MRKIKYKDKNGVSIYFERKRGRKGKEFMQGIDDHKNYFIFLDPYETKKQGREIWHLHIKSPQLL